MLNKIIVLTIIVSAFLLSACVQVVKEELPKKSALAVSSVWNRSINYPLGSTFSVVKKYAPSNSLNAKQTDFIYTQYQQAIINNLQQKGYKQVELGLRSDFIVGYGIALGRDFSDQQLTDKVGLTPGLSVKSANEKGSFLIYVQEGMTKLPIWKGVVQGYIDPMLSQTERKARASNVVNSLLSHFYNGQ